MFTGIGVSTCKENQWSTIHTKLDKLTIFRTFLLLTLNRMLKVEKVVLLRTWDSWPVYYTKVRAFPNISKLGKPVIDTKKMHFGYEDIGYWLVAKRSKSRVLSPWSQGSSLDP